MSQQRLLSILPRVLPLAMLVLASTPIYGQQPGSCTAASWSVGELTIPPDRPDARQGPFAGILPPTPSSTPRTFEAKFKARAADASGLGILSCIAKGNCGFGDLVSWIFEVAGWAGFSKGELARMVYLTPQGPAGAVARIEIEGSLDGLLAVSSFGLAASNAKVTGDVWATAGEDALTVLHEERSDESVLDQGVYFTPVSTTASRRVTVAIGEPLLLEGHLRAESNSARIPDLGAALGAAQFHEAVGGGFFDQLNPPISIPDPGLMMRATIINVSPVLAVNQPTVSFELGEEATNSGTVCDGDADPLTLTASMGAVTNHQDGTWSWSLPAGQGFPGRTVTITADDGEVTRTTTFQLVPSMRIDIRPKTTDDIIDLRNDGQVGVAILGGTHFDPLGQVQQASLRFGRTGNEDSLLRVGSAQKPACAGGDVNDDGHGDLVCSFQIPRMGFSCGDRVGILKAAVPFFDSSPVEGRGDVVLVPCNTIRTPTVVYEDPVPSSAYTGVAASPDGATLYIGTSDAILALSGSGGPPVQVNTGDLGYVAGLTVSPDGSRVFATLNHSGLAVTNPVVVSVPAGGGPATVLANLPADITPGGLAVSPDGTRLFIATGQESLLSVPSSGGVPVNILSGTYGVVTDVDVAATGATLYLGADLSDQILTVPAAGGVPTVVSTGVAFADPVNISLSPDKTTLFVLDPNIRIDASGVVVTSGGWPGAVFMGPSMGGRYVPLVVGGPDFSLIGRIDVSADGSNLYFAGTRRSTGTRVVLRVATGLHQ